MSIIFSLLFCLYLSMHTCNGRHLGVVDKNSGTQVHLLGKDVEKARLEKTSISSKTTKIQTLHQDSKNKESKMIHESEGGAASTRISKDSVKEVNGNKGTISGGGDHTESHASVSWRVPHEKRREHPGFNLDYSPPKTHPPSHN